MAKIQIKLTEPLLDGMDVRFKAPCDCTAIDGITVTFPQGDDGSTGSQTFTFKDAHGNTLTGLGNLFSKNALVKVMVDRVNSVAYIQNADTNKYLEDKIANAGTKVTLSSSVSSTSTTTAANSYAVKQAYDKAGVRGEAQWNSASSGTIDGGEIYYTKIDNIVVMHLWVSVEKASNVTDIMLNTSGVPNGLGHFLCMEATQKRAFFVTYQNNQFVFTPVDGQAISGMLRFDADFTLMTF